MIAIRKHSPRPVRLILILAVIYAFCWVKGWPRYYDDEELPPSQRSRTQTYAGPHQVGHENLIVSVISTATEVYTKIPPLVLFTPNEDHGQLLLFSDLQMEIGRWPVFDVLWRYSRDLIVEARQLGRYRAQIDYARKSMPIQKLRKQDPEEEKEIQNMLHKYKILQTMAAAWEYRPERSWYVFVNDETWMNRANLLDWLSQFNPKSMHFFGNPPDVKLPNPFAAGGTSIILSGQTMEALFGKKIKADKNSKDSEEVKVVRKNFIKNWQNQIGDHWSAFDLVFNVMQQELKLELEAASPGISGYDPTTVPFSPALWCEPVAMMHNVAADIASDLWKLEKERQEDHRSGIPLRFADLWQRFMVPENLNYTRKDWDNLSSESSNAHWNILFEGDTPDGGRAKSGEASVDACEDSCRQSDYCMQWSYSSIVQPNYNDNPPTKCHLSSSVRFGSYKGPQEWNIKGEANTLSWSSGWNKARFTTWANQQRCKAQQQR